MGKSVYIVLLLAVTLGLSACHKGGDEEIEAATETPVVLNVNVNLSDLLTRAGEEAAADNEKIQTLRVIVVNSKNDVEGNEVIDLTTTPVTEYAALQFKHVKSNDTKTIYLIANENTEIKTDIAGGVQRKLVDYDFSKTHIVPGQMKFPTDEVFNLKVNLNQKTDQLSPEQLTHSLPMSEFHRVRIPSTSNADTDKSDGTSDGFYLLDENDQILNPSAGQDEEIYGYRKTLWITRSAVKFTYNFVNETDKDVKISALKMDKMAKCEYFMPRVIERNGHEIKQFAVPTELTNNSGYYTFELASGEWPLTLAANGGEASLKPIYLLEGKYMDAGNENENLNYKVSLTIDHTQGEVTLSDYLPNLSQLPRNTHVIVNVTFKGPKIEWEVVVHPYIGVDLEPDFGL